MRIVFADQSFYSRSFPELGRAETELDAEVRDRRPRVSDDSARSPGRSAEPPRGEPGSALLYRLHPL
jgi:hypothetical protein